MKIIISTIIVLLILITTVSAEIEYQEISIDIDQNGVIEETISLVFKDLEQFNYHIIDAKINDLKINKYDLDVQCTVNEKEFGSDIFCSIKNADKNKHKIDFKFTNDQYIKKDKGNYFFEINHKSSFSVNKTFIEVKLPEAAVLMKNQELSLYSYDSAYFPDDVVKSSDGRRIILYWEKNKIKEFENIMVFVGFEKIEPSFKIVFLVSMIILFIIIIAMFTKKPNKKKEILFSILNENERKVLNIITKHNKKINQKTIAKESGFSKSKISRIVKNLEDRNIIDRERIGRTVFVNLKKDIKMD